MADISKKSSKKNAGIEARQFAVEWLFEITRRNRPLDEVLAHAENNPKWSKLDPRDKGFARLMIMAALRNKGDLEWLVGKFVKKLPAAKTHVTEILLIGAAQLVLLEVPPHAAIDMAVRQAKSSDKSRHLAKLVNAVLRRISEQGVQLLKDQPDVTRNIPAFLWRRWKRTYGERLAWQIGRAVLKPAALDIVAKSEPLELAKKLDAQPIGGNCVRLAHRGMIPGLPGFNEGEWWVQDFAAYLPTRLFGNISGKHILDLCAAPGGKTAALVAQGASVTSVDVSSKRLVRLHENLKRLKFEADVITKDVMEYEPETQPGGMLFDGVLLDAPCSATGTIRRHPDILHLKSETTIKELSVLQEKMLTRSIGFLKPGGVLIFCTCSLEPEEGELVIERFLENNPAIKRQPIEANEVFDQAEWLTNAGDLRLLPTFTPFTQEPMDSELSGMDGFFVSRLVAC